jgi:hypothetical protein
MSGYQPSAPRPAETASNRAFHAMTAPVADADESAKTAVIAKRLKAIAYPLRTERPNS